MSVGRYANSSPTSKIGRERAQFQKYIFSANGENIDNRAEWCIVKRIYRSAWFSKHVASCFRRFFSYSRFKISISKYSNLLKVRGLNMSASPQHYVTRQRTVMDTRERRRYLLWSPSATGQRQSVQADRARRVQPRHALISFVALVSLATFFTGRTLKSSYSRVIMYRSRAIST